MPVEGKSDMERIGLFSEMGYVTIGDKYKSLYMRPFNEAASKKRQMLSEGTKTLSALQAGYFEPQFVRIFEGEAYSNPVQLRRRYRLAESKKNVGKAFLPSNGDKLPCGLGSYYGTIGGSYAYFSPQLKSRERYIPPGKNFYTNPGKKGSGFGYANLTIGEQYPHEPDDYEAERIKAKKAQEEHKRLLKGGPFRLNLYPQEYFDSNPYFSDKPLPPVKKSPPKKPSAPPFIPSSPAKKSGGMKGGTFNPYPSYSAEPYVSKKSKAVTTGKEGKVFHPSSGPKSRPVTSIITLNVTRKKTPVCEIGFRIERKGLIVRYHYVLTDTIMMDSLKVFVKTKKFTYPREILKIIKCKKLQDYTADILLGIKGEMKGTLFRL